MFRRLFSFEKPRIAILPGQVLIKVTEEFLRQLMTRTNDGQAMTVTMGDEQPDGTHEPQITVVDDGHVLVSRIVLDEWRAFKDRPGTTAGSGRGKLVAVKGGRIEPVQ